MAAPPLSGWGCVGTATGGHDPPPILTPFGLFPQGVDKFGGVTPTLQVSGAGSAGTGGNYERSAPEQGAPTFAQGSYKISRSYKEQSWFLSDTCVEGDEGRLYSVSMSSTLALEPPLEGWVPTAHGKAPPPTLVDVQAELAAKAKAAAEEAARKAEEAAEAAKAAARQRAAEEAAERQRAAAKAAEEAAEAERQRLAAAAAEAEQKKRQQRGGMKPFDTPYRGPMAPSEAMALECAYPAGAVVYEADARDKGLFSCRCAAPVSPMIIGSVLLSSFSLLLSSPPPLLLRSSSTLPF